MHLIEAKQGIKGTVPQPQKPNKYIPNKYLDAKTTDRQRSINNCHPVTAKLASQQTFSIVFAETYYLKKVKSLDYETYSNPHSYEHGLTPLQHPTYEEFLNIADPRPDVDHAESNNTAIVGSRTIATITGKNHPHVIRDIRSLLKETKDDPDLDHVKVIKDHRGYTTEIQLTLDLALALVSGYSGQMRLAMIRAIRQLEPKSLPSTAIPSDKFVALAKITGELIDTREQLTDQITTLKYQSYLDEHKVTFHDNMVNVTNLFSIGEVSKLLGIGKNRLLKLLRKHKILMSGTKSHNQPYQKYINAGWLKLKLALTESTTEDTHAKAETMITGKGVTCIADLLEK